jgi:pyruvate/2-oxoglutarate dehydrogenase complex dihydrolipoamide dehydrogenase (E3) component
VQESLRFSQSPDYQNPAPKGRYNLVVIGAGTAGLVAAKGAAALGARVALVEKNMIGGHRLLGADLPSNVLVHAAREIADVRRTTELGVKSTVEPVIDLGAVMERVRGFNTRQLSQDNLEALTHLGVDVYLGEARFTDGRHITVGKHRLEFSRALVATGSSPVMPAITGLAEAKPLTSESVFGLTQVPQSLAIIGAGQIGCGMAQVFARFGSRVSVYEKEPRILLDYDLAPARIVQKSIEHDGVRFRFGCTDLSLSRNEGRGKIGGTSGGTEFADDFDCLLVCAGRRPNVDELGLESARVMYDEQGILISDHMRTTHPRIFAAGDVCSKYKFTHVADTMGRIVIGNALFFASQRVAWHLIPRCTFTDPEIAHVGLGEQDSPSKHIVVADFPFSENDRAQLEGDEDGMLRIYHDRRGGIHGATVVGRHANEMIGEIAVAMHHRIKLGSLASDVHPYPTRSEMIKRAGDAYRRTLLTPSILSFLKKLMEWRR